MAPRRRQPRRQTVGNTRMDAALDAMRQLGFEEKLIRETVEELLDVYEGNQGWPFIEEGSYKLLIETILCKEPTCDEDKDDVRKDGVGETSSAATPATGITEVGSSYLVHQDHVPRGNDDLDSASQTNDHDHDSTPIGNVEEEVGVKDNVEATTDKLPQSRHRPCYGWISSDDNDVDLIYFQPPPLPKHIEKLIGKSLAHERPNRKSRWDEKPDDM